MVLYKTYKVNGVDAFTLCLVQSLVTGNKILASLPNDFLVYYFKKELSSVRTAYLPHESMAITCLDDLAKKIMSISHVAQLYYPPFIRYGTEVNESTIFRVISAQNHLHVWPNTHYCMFNQEIHFFVMKGLYVVERMINDPCMNEVPLDEFSSYLTSPEMKLDFDRLSTPGNKAYRVKEEGQLRYLLLVTENEELLMVVAL